MFDSKDVLFLLVDVSLKSLLLAVIAAAGLALFRVRNSNVRHRVWTAVLTAMFFLPLLVQVVPGVALPVHGLYGIPDADLTAVDEDSTTKNTTAVASKSPINRTLPNDSARVSPARGLPGTKVDLPPMPVETASLPRENRSETPSGIVDPLSNAAPSGSVTTVGGWTWEPASAYRAALAVYLAIAAVLLYRLLVAWNRTRRLVRSGCRLPADEIGWTDTVLRERGFIQRRIALIESDAIRVPLTVGWLRPSVLFPPGWKLWSAEKRRAVLQHELAHVARGDYLVVILAQLNRCLYWFHPLAWGLARRLSELAEQNCDDAVIASTGDRATYAQHLLEIAESLAGRRGRVVKTGVSMARTAYVETRIKAILDTKRPLARRIGWRGTLCSFAVMLPVACVAAALQPGTSEKSGPAAVAAQEPQSDPRSRGETKVRPQADRPVDRNDAAVDAKTDEAPAEQQLEYAGRVMDADGKPLAGAKVFLVYIAHGFKYEEHARTDADGRFRFQVKESDFNTTYSLRPWRRALVAATADGFGPAFARAGRPSQAKNVILKLPKDDIPIEGRVVSLEGKPIAGVKVSCGMLSVNSAPDGRPLPFDSKSESDFSAKMPIHDLLSEVTTDRDGRFQIKGLGRERRLKIYFESPTIERQGVEVVTRLQPTQRLRGTGFYYRNGKSPFKIRYGAKFTHVAAPSRPIAVVVRDRESKKPLPGVRVQRVFTQSNEPTAWGVTNQQGEFRLTGLAIADDHELFVVTPDELPYFNTSIICSTAGATTDPVRVVIELQRGIAISGRLVYRATGQPVRGVVYYRPLRSNPLVEAFPVLRSPFSYIPFQPAPTGPDGKFHITALPGRGVLMASGMQQLPLLDLRAEDRDKRLLDDKDHLLLATWPRPKFLRNFGAYRFLDLGKNVKSDQFDLKIDTGRTVAGKVVDPNGRPLHEVRAFGTVELILEDGTFEATRIAREHPRILYFYHKQRNLAGHYLARGNETGTVTVTLRPCGSIAGQLVDANGKPVTGVHFRLLYVEADGEPRIFFPLGRRVPTAADRARRVKTDGRGGRSSYTSGKATDENGRFKIDRLIPDLKFQLMARPQSDRNRQVIATTTAAAGQTVDLGKIEVGKQNASRRKSTD